MNIYRINKIPRNVVASLPWESAHSLTDFIYPWEDERPPSTKFRALHDGEFLYFRFDVTDASIHTFQVNNNKREVGFSDRVEIFLTTDPHLSTYFGLEIDSIGRVMDFKASYHKKLDFDWAWPESMNLKTSQNNSGYTVEGRLSIQQLKKLSLLHDGVMIVGLFRANCQQLTDNEDTIKWISWVDPNTPIPDFHIPETFGQLIFMTD